MDPPDEPRLATVTGLMDLGALNPYGSQNLATSFPVTGFNIVQNVNWDSKDFPKDLEDSLGTEGLSWICISNFCEISQAANHPHGVIAWRGSANLDVFTLDEKTVKLGTENL